MLQNLGETVPHAVVVLLCARALCDESGLDGVHRDHNATGPRRRQRAQHRVLHCAARSVHHSPEPLFQLLEHHPREGVGGDLLHERRQPAPVEAQQPLTARDVQHRHEEVVVHARHDAVGQHHLRRAHHRADEGGDGAGQEVQRWVQHMRRHQPCKRGVSCQLCHLHLRSLSDCEANSPMGHGHDELGASAAREDAPPERRHLAALGLQQRFDDVEGVHCSSRSTTSHCSRGHKPIIGEHPCPIGVQRVKHRC
mmetsp:Transcript_7277/g.12090  ORF Transcript_7277/g.12090 Transcript_7277/m.12090 type:complete len:253 (-) Transcript_7277:516-1274(-)